MEEVAHEDAVDCRSFDLRHVLQQRSREAETDLCTNWNIEALVVVAVELLVGTARQVVLMTKLPGDVLVECLG